MFELVIGFAVAAVLMIVEYLLCTKMKNPLWGGIIPFLILGGTILIFACGKIPLEKTYILGFKNKEIAALYGCNARKISYHKMRAVRQIRAEMEVRRHE
ncbi:TPA: hypothetical protein ACMU4Q_000187 [Clostridioides difficile]